MGDQLRHIARPVPAGRRDLGGRLGLVFVHAGSTADQRRVRRKLLDDFTTTLPCRYGGGWGWLISLFWISLP
jgi:hypothetical protein